ncbi:MAG: hypothetical protein ABIO49_14000 [Dokdonella sp.]
MPNFKSQSLTQLNGRKASRATMAGALRGDLATVAMRLHDALHQSDITVWTNARSDVFFDAPESSPNVASEWLAGTYGVGASASDIEADLMALRHECVSAAILD